MTTLWIKDYLRSGCQGVILQNAPVEMFSGFIAMRIVSSVCVLQYCTFVK